MVISGRAALEQDLLGGVIATISWESAVPSGDLKRDHGAEIMVHAYGTMQAPWERDFSMYTTHETIRNNLG